MKKIILTSAIIFAALGTSLAQFEESKSQTTTLKVILHKVQSIKVNHASVELNYSDIEDYNLGVTAIEKDHLSVYSVGGFIVNVNSEADALGGSSASEGIKSSGIKIKATVGTDNGLKNLSLPEVGLSKNGASLITSTTGGLEQKFTVQYKGDGTLAYAKAAYFKDDAVGAATTVHSTTVTYSIEPN